MAPAPLAAFADHGAGGDIQCCKKRRRAVSDAGVGAPLGHAGRHWQHRLFAIQRLDLRFLVNTQHDSPVRR